MVVEHDRTGIVSAWVIHSKTCQCRVDEAYGEVLTKHIQVIERLTPQ